MTLGKRSLIGLLLCGLPVWAASVPGIDNFYQVNQKVYRGAQPTDDGFKYLSSVGVKLVIDLREHDQRAAHEESVVKADGMQYLNVPMTGMTPPTAAEMSKILALLEDGNSGPVFVHCKRGADRTGAVIAAYRIDHDQWENSRALSEAMGNRMSKLQFQRQKFIREYQGKPVVVAMDASAAPAIDPATAAPATATAVAANAK
jgi:protein-tyrosine phosphatase